MKKLWSFFWLVVASCIAFSIIASLIAPYLWMIGLVLVVVVLGVVGFKAWRLYSRGRRHF